ncbi:hypothetical protein RHECNPAF_1330021 [Rhizobium etli CNPAF512]|nr:hypothetical protein RHECNPAF_1330021 [Rhizobium etli CNPAF512]
MGEAIRDIISLWVQCCFVLLPRSVLT